jgi:hypothetical protein
MKRISKIVLGLVVIMSLSGCLSEKVYTAGKVVHAGAEAVYIELDIKNEKIENINNVVVSYDTVRTKVKDAISDNKKKEVAGTLATPMN